MFFFTIVYQFMWIWNYCQKEIGRFVMRLMSLTGEKIKLKIALNKTLMIVARPKNVMNNNNNNTPPNAHITLSLFLFYESCSKKRKKRKINVTFNIIVAIESCVFELFGLGEQLFSIQFQRQFNSIHLFPFNSNR